MKVKISEKSSFLEVSESKIAELTKKVNEQQKLISKLEDDILKVCGLRKCFSLIKIGTLFFLAALCAHS